MKDCLKLIHFHIGSQVTKIRRIKNALREASQFLCAAAQDGLQRRICGYWRRYWELIMTELARPSSESSVNYSIQEYVNDSDVDFGRCCATKTGIPHPEYHYRDGTRTDCPSLRAYLRSAGNRYPARNGTTTEEIARGCSRTGAGTI